MTRTTRHITRLLLPCVLALALSSCVKGLIDLNDNEICDYTVRLRYDYNKENSTSDNMFDYYIRTLDEYIFDDLGVLVDARSARRDVCDGTWHSDLDLPPGRYSVIAVGNRDTRSPVWDEATGNAPVKGQTHRDDMRMALLNAEQRAGNTVGPSEPLYHGYRTFTIAADRPSYIRVDMVHSHLDLKFRVTWKNGAPAEKTGYHITMEPVPSQYNLMPEYYYPRGSFQHERHDPATSDHYEAQSEAVIHHIPTVRQDANTLAYRHDTYITNDNEMWGEFIAYRIRSETPVRLWFWHYDEATQATTPLLTNGFDLQGYFAHRMEPLDYTLKQEYVISIVIDGDTATALPLDVADWEEGGTIQ